MIPDTAPLALLLARFYQLFRRPFLWLRGHFTFFELPGGGAGSQFFISFTFPPPLNPPPSLSFVVFSFSADYFYKDAVFFPLLTHRRFGLEKVACGASRPGFSTRNSIWFWPGFFTNRRSPPLWTPRVFVHPANIAQMSLDELLVIETPLLFTS